MSCILHKFTLNIIVLVLLQAARCAVHAITLLAIIALNTLRLLGSQLVNSRLRIAIRVAYLVIALANQLRT